MRTLRPVVPALALTLVLALAGCSTSGEGPQSAASSAGDSPGLPTPSGEVSGDVAPSGGATEGAWRTETEQELRLGEEATATYSPNPDRTSLLTATVDRVRVGSAEDFTTFSLSPAERRSRIYYVDATLSNDGGQDLGGAALPLYAVDGAGIAVQPTSLVGTFRPCPGGGVLPKSFPPTKQTRTCLLYLLPRGEELAGVRLPDAEGAGFLWAVPDLADKGDDGDGDDWNRGAQRDDKGSDR